MSIPVTLLPAIASEAIELWLKLKAAQAAKEGKSVEDLILEMKPLPDPETLIQGFLEGDQD